MKYDISYTIDDMTSLRYYVPLLKSIYRLRPDLKQAFIYKTDNFKYNGLGQNQNLIRFQKICKEIQYELDPLCIFEYKNINSTDSEISCHTMITIEYSLMNIKHEYCISLAHGFDSILCYSKKLKDFCDVFICDKMFENHEKLTDVNKMHPPIPISMLLAKEYQDIKEDQEKTATVFYPDLDLNEFADNIIAELCRKKYYVYIKQRKKWQKITAHVAPNEGEIIYDNHWSPSESILCPLISDVTIGFGSTAYIDLVPIGIPFINVDVKHNQHPWNQMIHPICENYVHTTSTNVNEIIEIALKMNMFYVKDVQNNKKMDDFIQEVICRKM